MTIIQKKISSRLKNLGIRPIDLARESGVKYSSVKNIVQGKVSRPRDEILYKIANVLNVPPAELLSSIDSAKDQELFSECQNIMITLFEQHDLHSQEKFEECVNQLFNFAKLHAEYQNIQVKTDDKMAQITLNFVTKYK